MMEFINSCIRWVAENYKAILMVVTSTQFISLVSAIVLLVKSLRAGKDNTASTKALNETMEKTNGMSVTVDDINANVTLLQGDNLTIKEELKRFETEQKEYLDNLTTKLNAILEVQSVVYSTIKNEDIRNTVNALLVNAKYAETANRAKLRKEIDDLKAKVASQVTEVQATVEKASDVVKNIVSPKAESTDNIVRY